MNYRVIKCIVAILSQRGFHNIAKINQSTNSPLGVSCNFYSARVSHGACQLHYQLADQHDPNTFQTKGEPLAAAHPSTQHHQTTTLPDFQLTFRIAPLSPSGTLLPDRLHQSHHLSAFCLSPEHPFLLRIQSNLPVPTRGRWEQEIRNGPFQKHSQAPPSPAFVHHCRP